MRSLDIQKRRAFSALTTASVLAAFSACTTDVSTNSSLPGDNLPATPSVAVTAGELTGPNGLSLHALASFNVAQDHTIAIYEPTPGLLGVLEARLPDQHPVWERATSDVLELFARYQPDQAAPIALIEAYERSLEAQHAQRDLRDEPFQWGGGSAAESASNPLQPVGDVGVRAEALTASSNPKGFVNDGGCNWGSANSACKVNWANGFWAQANGISQTCDVCTYAGNGVTMTMKVGGTATIALGISSGNCATLTTSGASVARRMEVTNASGDAFHAGCRWTK